MLPRASDRGTGWRQVSCTTWEWFIYTEGENGRHTNTACPHGKKITYWHKRGEQLRNE